MISRSNRIACFIKSLHNVNGVVNFRCSFNKKAPVFNYRGAA